MTFRKIYWKTRNIITTPFLRLVGNTGLLPTRKDPKDRIATFGGMFRAAYKTKKTDLSSFKYQYKQRDNICTAAGAVLALSEQTGIRWSIKAVMRMMVKDGQVHGNGLSHQRAPLDVMVKYGLVPYEDMPDENDKGWADFSKWDKETERLYNEVAPKYKVCEYKALTDESAILGEVFQVQE